MQRRLAFIAPLLGALTLLFLSACATVQESGRSQLMLMTPSQEAAMGAQAFADIKKNEKISTDPVLNARIRRIGERVAAAVGRDLPDAKWEFVVFESDTINAFALPGGKVGFYTGLINLAASDDELAVVMGHEIAHVTARHGAERMSQAMLIGLGGVALGAATQNDRNQYYYMLAYGIGSTLGSLAYSRSHEIEADEIGLRYAAQAGYDPRAAVSFWSKMAAKETGGRPLKLLSTHPPSAERIQNLRRLSVELMPVYERARLAREGPLADLAAPAGASAPVRSARTEQQELDRFHGR